MPTTFWFLRILVLIALLAYAAMAALVWSVNPGVVEYSEPIAIELPPRQTGAAPHPAGNLEDGAPAITGTAQ